MSEQERVLGWRAWLGLERPAQLAVFVVAMLGVVALLVFAYAAPTSWTHGCLLLVTLLCLWSASRLSARGFLVHQRLGEIQQAFARGEVPARSRASSVLGVLGCGLALVNVWVTFHG